MLELSLTMHGRRRRKASLKEKVDQITWPTSLGEAMPFKGVHEETLERGP